MFGLWKWVLNWKGEIMQTYKGLYVPPKVTKAENQVALRKTFNRLISRGAVGKCVVAHTLTSLEGKPCPLGTSCATCICDTCNADQFREFMDEYFGKEENKGEENMEKAIRRVLKPGMILKTNAGEFFMWIGGPRSEAYELELAVGGPCSYDKHIRVRESITDFSSFSKVDAVFTDVAETAPAIRVQCIIELMQGRAVEPFVRCAWKRPEPVKEMTVDEISKALGYKVKVVGNEKTDD